jgi:alcohol dehydrogenase class IV
VVSDPGDIAARSDVMFAAYCAGMAINTTGTAAAHAIQSPMAAIGHTSHGFGVGALLPYVMRWNLPHATAEFADIGRILGCTAASERDLARAGIARVEDMLAAVGTPLEIASLGVTSGNFDQIATAAVSAKRLVRNNPAPMTPDSVRALLARAVAGDRSWWAVP